MINKYSTRILVNFISIRKKLKEEFFYSEKDVLHTVWRLMNASDTIKVAFARWFNDGVEPQIECEGIKWAELVANRKLNPFNAFLFMDTMLEDPDYGITLLTGQMRPSMRIKADRLRPELRDYVLKKESEEKGRKEIVKDEEGNIDLK